MAFGDDEEGLIARRKPGLAFTLGAMGSRQDNFYTAAFQRAGYADVARGGRPGPAAGARSPEHRRLVTPDHAG